MSDQQTKRNEYIGRAAADLNSSGTTLQVLVPELTPAALNGTFAPGTTPVSVQMTNLSGGKISAAPTTANHIVAVWEGTSNHAYPPFVKAGEQVKIIQYGDSDRYYWQEMGRDRELRKLDRIRIEVSATPAANAAKSDTNTYFLELDAVSGTVQIKTSKANSEPFAYGIRIDAKNGTIVISDDAGPTPNRIYLDSGINGGVPKVMLNNSANASLVLTGPDIVISAPRDILQIAGRQIIQTAPIATMNWNIGSINGTALGVYSTESMVVRAPTFSVLGNSKITGLITTSGVRAGTYYTGAVGTAPASPITAPTTGTGKSGGNVPDTTVPTVVRHAAASENLVEMAATITNYFTQIQGHIGVPSVDSTLNTQAAASSMLSNTGT